MSDATLRALERVAASGDPADCARLLAARLRVDAIRYEHVSVAAWLGDEGARLTGVAPWVPDDHMPSWSYPARHALRWAPIERTLLIRAAALCSARALPIFERRRGVGRPRVAIEAALAWAQCPCETHRAAAYAAAAAAARLKSNRHMAALIRKRVPNPEAP